jgi:flagellar biogenesis protein FliO
MKTGSRQFEFNSSGAGSAGPIRCVALSTILFLLCLTGSLAAQTATTRPGAGGHDPFADLPSYGEMVRHTAYTLVAIIVVFAFAAKYLPRWLGRTRFMPRGKLIQVIERHALEPRKTVYLLKVADQYFLVGSTGDRIETLAGGPLDQETIRQRLAELERAKEPRPNKPTTQPLAPQAVSFPEVLRGK